MNKLLLELEVEPFPDVIKVSKMNKRQLELKRIVSLLNMII